MWMHPTTLRNRAVIRISGTEARPFLQGLLTQDVMSVAPGAPRWGALLTPQGKALFDMMLWADPDQPEDILIDCEADRADLLIRRLSLYRLRRPVGIAREDNLAVHWSPDADAPGVPDPRLATLGHRWLAPATDGDAAPAFLLTRVKQSVLEGAAELGEDKTLWLETKAEELNGVNYSKGCYIGQENTARMHYRNKVNRRLVALPIDQSDPARQRHVYSELGIAIDHRPVDKLAGLDLPDWLAQAIAEEPVTETPDA